MKVYQSIRTYFVDLGLHASSQFDQKDSNNAKCLMTLVLLFIGAISTFAFILFEAQTFEECANGFNTALTLALGAFDLVICIWKMERLFKFMKEFDFFVKKSK